MYQKLGKTGLTVKLVDGIQRGQATVEFENEPGQLWRVHVFERAPHLVFCVRL